MFFYASKLFWFLAAPTHVLVVLAMLGAVLMFTRWKRLARAVVVANAVGLALIGFSPLPKAALRPLEDRFQQNRAEGWPVDGIIVLGGAIGHARGQIVFNEAASRMTAAIELAHRHPQARLVFTGGDSAVFASGTETEAAAAARLFRAAGLVDDRLVLEDRARNTRENALYTVELIDPKPGERWLLITSAFHMPRAVGAFRQLGMEPEPFPVDYRTDGDRRDFVRPFRHMSNGFQFADLAVREWIGLVAYRIAGYTPALFPAPLAPASAAGSPMR